MKYLSVILPVFFSSFGFAKAEPKVHLEPIYTNLTIERPVAMVIPEDGTNRRFLIEQTGKIKILPDDESGSTAETFMDFSGRMSVHKAFEEGLLGIAFHPDFKNNGRCYVYYSKQGPKRSVLSEFTVSKQDPNKGNPDSERILMEIQQPDWNHNSGNLLFGPADGYLYIGVGDGGRRNGVFLAAQNKMRWNGKVLRIDVDSRSGSRPYGIPEDNPFVDDKNACPEIWAYGLRNPWGCSIDPDTGLFYLADVGQDLWEEVNIIKKGGNYGWEFREGAQDFAMREKLAAAINEANKKPKGETFIDPIHQYDHSPTGGMSITGGYVYHGEAIPELKGCFIYGDWRFGNMWALRHDEKSGTTTNYVIHTPPSVAEPVAQPTGFYPDENGEPVVLG
ncbi:MAG: PQQ-dependent sugar dehydrogenase, partial [Verrucomicrobiales bacterium]|nr:PQQ-dependent sugar dehydrogenase [Verrucomicrobiales bacterium]